MKYRTLGRTGVKVSALAFGTMSFGGDADEETSQALYRRCRDVGINHFDCADVYQKGVSEEILRRLDDSETPIDALAEDVKLGARLIRELDGKLRKVESEVVDALEELERSADPKPEAEPAE